MVSGPDATLAATTSATGDVRLQIVNLHGDVAATIDTTLTAPTLRYFDEFGVPTTGQATARYGWLGAHQRSAEALGGTILMGVRLYNVDTGRFASVDPIDGGSATAYDYANQDPVNEYDLDGRYPGGCWKPWHRKPTAREQAIYRSCLARHRAFARDSERPARKIQACFWGGMTGSSTAMGGNLITNILRHWSGKRLVSLTAGWQGVAAVAIIYCLVNAWGV